MDVNDLLIIALVLGLILIVVLAIYLYTLWGVNATTAALEAELLAKKRLQDGGKQSIGPGPGPVTLERWATEGQGTHATDNEVMETDLVDLMMEDSNRLGSPLSDDDGLRSVIHNPLFPGQADGGAGGGGGGGGGGGIVKRESFKREKAAAKDCYPGSGITPAPVALKGWDQQDPSYRATTYTAPEVLQDPKSDPGLISLQRPGTALFNQVDATTRPPIDRRSNYGRYDVVGGVPLCPLGRSGVSGRGALRRWGPNHEIVAVVCKQSSAGELLVLATGREGMGGYALPHSPVRDGVESQMATYTTLMDIVFGNVPSNEQAAVFDELEPKLSDGEKVVFKGIVSDPRTTDNAWVEMMVTRFFLHDTSDGLSVFAKLKSQSLFWAPAQKDMFAATYQHIIGLVTDGADDATARGISILDAQGAAASMSVLSHTTADGLLGPADLNVSIMSQESTASAMSAITSPPPAPVSNNNELGAMRNLAKEMLHGRDGGGDGDGNDTPASDYTPTGTQDRNNPAEIERRASLASQKARFIEERRFSQPAPGATERNPDARAPKEGEIKAEILSYWGKQAINAIDLNNPHAKKQEATTSVRELKNNGLHQIVRLIIGAEGVDIEEVPTFDDNRKRKWTDPTMLMKKSKTMMTIPIRNIAYTTTDVQKRRVFIFLATDPKTQIGYCYVFESKFKAKYLTEAISQAFDQAQRIKQDPFALNREGEVTPDAAGMAAMFDEFAMNRKRLSARMIIGHGQYGKVYLADLVNHQGVKEKAAVKLMRPELSHVNGKDFLGEAALMLKFRHHKLLELLGVCIEKKPWMIVVNFMHYKDLGIVLQQCKKNNVLLRSHEMLTFCEQVAVGMVYMAEHRFIHRDLAARNVLLTHDNQVRIGDFGLARELPEEKEYWRLDKAGRLPVKYMAVETLTSKRFSVASDVWAFGVYMWEVMAYSATPWSSQNIAVVDIKDAVANGMRLEKPPMELLSESDDVQIPEDMEEPPSTEYLDVGTEATLVWDWWYALLLDTWAAKPKDRPTFQTLQADLLREFNKESKRLPPMRDIGLACYEALEGTSSRDPKQRGGSIIRAAATLKRTAKQAIAAIAEEDEGGDEGEAGGGGGDEGDDE